MSTFWVVLEIFLVVLERNKWFFAIGSILLAMPRSPAMTLSSWLISSSIVLLPTLYVVVMSLFRSCLYFSDIISYRFVVFSAKTKMLGEACICLTSFF